VRIRVVSWNVDSRPTGLLDAKVELLRTLRPDLALLQEIGRPVYRALLPHPSAHERMHRKSRQFSWGALSTDLAEPRASEFRLGCAVLGVSTTALLDAHVLNSAPFDVRDPVLPGFLWRTVAAQVALSTGAMLTVPGPVLFGIDAGPLVLDGADPLLGPTPVHGLHDVLRATHDHLWATRDLAVLDVQCLPDDAAAAGSDHAVLVADLELRDS
jgi:endonuclease/exonuclease/phosphatase family metal-dependent hydrolase